MRPKWRGGWPAGFRASDLSAPDIYAVSAAAHQDIDVLCCANFNARHPGALDAAQFLLLGWLLPGKTLPHDLHRHCSPRSLAAEQCHS